MLAALILAVAMAAAVSPAGAAPRATGQAAARGGLPAGAAAWAAVREWELVVEHTVSARSSQEFEAAGTRLSSTDTELLRCSFRVKLQREAGDEAGHEDGAEWVGQGRGSGAGYRRIREKALAGGQRMDSSDSRAASGAFQAEGRLQIDFQEGSYRFDVTGDEGMSGTRRVRKPGASSTFRESRSCAAGIPTQRLPAPRPAVLGSPASSRTATAVPRSGPAQAGGTVLEGSVTQEEAPARSVVPGMRARASRLVTTRWTLQPLARERTRLVIEPGPGYDTWLPEGSDGPQGLGAVHSVRLRLQGGDGGAPRQAATRLRVRLTQVSREKGTSLNWPRQGDTSPDLFFRSQGQEGLVEMREGGQELILEGGRTEWVVPVYANDYGAYGELIAQAELAGGGVAVGERAGPQPASYLALPKDDNHNHIADAWEAAVRAGSSDPHADDDDTPAGLARPGDGLSLYEEYRGLRTRDHVHRRFDPERPDLFLVDQSRLVPPADWRAITGIELHHVLWEHLPAGDRLPLDPATSRELRRVNYHAGYAAGESAHAVWVHANRGMDDSIIFQGPLRLRMPAGEAAVTAFPYRLGTTLHVSQYDAALAEVEGGRAWAPANIFVSYINYDMLHRLAYFGLQSKLQKVADGLSPPSTGSGATPAEAGPLARRLREGEARIDASMPAFLARVAMHELMHAIGSDHHEPGVHGGVANCLMRYPTDAEEARYLLDGAAEPQVCQAMTCRPRMRLLP